MDDAYHRIIFKTDLEGNLGKLKHFSGDVRLSCDGQMNMFIDYIEGNGINMRNFMNSLIMFAKSKGAVSLQLELQVKNKKLKDFWMKHWNLRPGNIDWTRGINLNANVTAYDSIFIDLKLK